MNEAVKTLPPFVRKRLTDFDQPEFGAPHIMSRGCAVAACDINCDIHRELYRVTTMLDNCKRGTTKYI